MDLNAREVWPLIHGSALGLLFLLAFAAGLAGRWRLRSGRMTAVGIGRRIRRLYVSAWVMALAAWAMVITGTWIIYPWYRARLAPVGDDLYAGCAGLARPSASCSARDFLLSNVSGSSDAWHSFGMEWKEHVAWTAPILATAAAFLISYYGLRLAARPWLRAVVIGMFVAAFAVVVVAGALGAALGNIAPVA